MRQYANGHACTHASERARKRERAIHTLLRARKLIAEQQQLAEARAALSELRMARRQTGPPVYTCVPGKLSLSLSRSALTNGRLHGAPGFEN